MTPMRDWFSSLTASSNQSITLGDSHTVLVSGTGQIPILRSLIDPRHSTLEALYVPDLAFNLLSVAALDSQGAQVLFGGGKVTISDSATGTVLASGERDGALFKLTTLLFRGSVSSSLWHARYGHLNYSYMQQASRSRHPGSLWSMDFPLFALLRASATLVRRASNIVTPFRQSRLKPEIQSR